MISRYIRIENYDRNNGTSESDPTIKGFNFEDKHFFVMPYIGGWFEAELVAYYDGIARGKIVPNGTILEAIIEENSNKSNLTNRNQAA